MFKISQLWIDLRQLKSESLFEKSYFLTQKCITWQTYFYTRSFATEGVVEAKIKVAFWKLSALKMAGREFQTNFMIMRRFLIHLTIADLDGVLSCSMEVRRCHQFENFFGLCEAKPTLIPNQQSTSLPSNCPWTSQWCEHKILVASSLFDKVNNLKRELEVEKRFTKFMDYSGDFGKRNVKDWKMSWRRHKLLWDICRNKALHI